MPHRSRACFEDRQPRNRNSFVFQTSKFPSELVGIHCHFVCHCLSFISLIMKTKSSFSLSLEFVFNRIRHVAAFLSHSDSKRTHHQMVNFPFIFYLGNKLFWCGYLPHSLVSTPAVTSVNVFIEYHHAPWSPPTPACIRCPTPSPNCWRISSGRNGGSPRSSSRSPTPGRPRRSFGIVAEATSQKIQGSNLAQDKTGMQRLYSLMSLFSFCI